MRNRKIDLGALLATVLTGTGAALLLSGNEERLLETVEQLPVWMGIYFLALFLVGFVTLQIRLHFSGYQVQRSRHWIAASAFAAVCIFLIGSAAQFFYMYSREEITHNTVIQKQVDMILLLDASGSMESNGYEASRDEAAIQFVNSLAEDVQLQTVAFAGADWALESTDLIKMDAAGKDCARSFIAQIDCTGTTNFDSALAHGLGTLMQHPAVRADSAKAVILMTDGDDHTLTDTHFRAYQDAGIKLFTIRISSERASASMQMLCDFAVSTGGFDTQIKPNANGNVGVDGMLEAFRNAFQATTEAEVEVVTNYTDNLLIRTEPVGIGHHLLRTVALMAICILFGIGYFGKVTPGNLVWNAGFGLVLSILAAVWGSEISLRAAAVLSAALVVPAYVTLNIPEGDDIRV